MPEGVISGPQWITRAHTNRANPHCHRAYAGLNRAVRPNPSRIHASSKCTLSVTIDQ